MTMPDVSVTCPNCGAPLPETEVDLGPTSPVPIVRGMDKKTKVKRMLQWFFMNFEDPAMNTPCDEGYVYIWGGPHDARDELEDAFGDTVSEQAIEDAVNRIERDGWEWAPHNRRLYEKTTDHVCVRKTDETGDS